MLGRNPELSYAELVSYFETERIKFKKIFEHNNKLLLDLSKDFNEDIQKFGGLLKVGKIRFKGDEDEFRNYVDKEELVESDKFTFSVTGNINEEIFSEKFKAEGRKAMIKRGRKKLDLQKGKTILVPKADFEFYAQLVGDVVYYGLVDQDYSYYEVKERDMKKPVRRESLAISPRLAKMMINLSQVKRGGLLLDAFCGVGGILQEGLIQEINCYGIDKDKKAIDSARKNLKWIENRYNTGASWKLQAMDSRKAPNIKVDAIVSEPALGEIVRKKPTDAKAKEIISGFEKLIISVLKRLVEIKKPGARVVLTMPRIRDIGVDLNKICKATRLRVANSHEISYPIQEERERSFIGRDVVVLV
jgi:tRNA G10  N-methylase Trm11